MEVASTKVEEVKVVEKAPLVSTSTPNVNEVFDVDFVANMPHDNRDVVFQQITNYAAGAIRGGRVRGGAANQTILMMDGFNMLRQFPTMKSAAAYEIQTAAYGAENAIAPGGVVNLATKSGSNKFEFELNATADDSALTFFKKDFDSKRHSFFYVVNPTVSGPILKDKLWYSANVEILTRTTGRDLDPNDILPEPLPEHRYWHKGTVKLTWQMTARNKLQQRDQLRRVLDEEPRAARHRRRGPAQLPVEELLQRPDLGEPADRQPHLPQPGRRQQHRAPRLAGAVRDRPRPLRLRALAGCRPSPARLVYGNANLHDRTRTYSFQFDNRLECSSNAKALGEHHIQLQDKFMTQGDCQRPLGARAIRCTSGSERPGQRARGAHRLTTRTTPGLSRHATGWFFTTATATRNALSLSDRFRPTRHLTITPGIAYVDRQGRQQPGRRRCSTATPSPPAPPSPGTPPTTAAPPCGPASTTTSTPRSSPSPATPWAARCSSRCR